MLPMNFSTVLATLQSPAPLRIFDTEGRYESGAWVEKIITTNSPQPSENTEHNNTPLNPTHNIQNNPTEGAWGESFPPAAGGIPSSHPLPSREIRAIILALKAADLEFLREGYSTDSGISLHTRETLYFVDANNMAEGQERRQSYVEYQGYLFRVVGTGFMGLNADFNLYHCVRYLRAF